MKTLLRKLRRLLSLGGAVAALTAGAATTPTPDVATPERAASAPLKVLVNVPPTWDLFLDERLGDAFTEQVQVILESAGFRQPVEAMRFVENPDKVPYLLTVNLHDWRINRSGQVVCTFGATLQTPQGQRDLGLYTHTRMRWLESPGRYGVSAAFENAAAGAIRNMCDTIIRSEMLPGLQPDRRYAGLPRLQRPALTPNT